MKEVLTKLSTIQKELKAPKNLYNKFGGYNYRSCEDILEAAKPICNKYGCALIVGDKMENIGERYYIQATATLYDCETGQSVSNTAYAREEETKKGMDGAQITGTASSYARKYALNGLFCIDDTKDADTDEYTTQQTNSKAAKAPKPSPAPAKVEKPAEIKCPKCGKPVQGVKRPDGTSATPQEVLKGCGGMCYSCYQAAKAAYQNIGG